METNMYSDFCFFLRIHHIWKHPHHVSSEWKTCFETLLDYIGQLTEKFVTEIAHALINLEYQLIGLREQLQEHPVFHGKIDGFRSRFSHGKSTHWESIHHLTVDPPESQGSTYRLGFLSCYLELAWQIHTTKSRSPNSNILAILQVCPLDFHNIPTKWIATPVSSKHRWFVYHEPNYE